MGFAALSTPVYNPLRSELVQKALDKGVPAEGGLYMLVAQAAYACEKFIDTEISVNEIDRVFKKLERDKQNIVLVGMPGSGKTTIGKELAKKLGREFIDTDDVIKEQFGDISEIFKVNGEQYFRKLERDVILETGGKAVRLSPPEAGAVLCSENVFRLRQKRKNIFSRPSARADNSHLRSSPCP